MLHRNEMTKPGKYPFHTSIHPQTDTQKHNCNNKISAFISIRQRLAIFLAILYEHNNLYTCQKSYSMLFMGGIECWQHCTDNFVPANQLYEFYIFLKIN